MIWVNYLFLVIYLILCAGPLREAFLGRWRFSLCFTLGMVVGVVVGVKVLDAGLSWYAPTGFGLFLGLGFGVASQEFFDDLFGKEA